MTRRDLERAARAFPKPACPRPGVMCALLMYYWSQDSGMDSSVFVENNAHTHSMGWGPAGAVRPVFLS